MILIVDSGSSKADWVLLNKDQIFSQLKTKGINPFFQSSNEIHDLVKNTFELSQADKIENIFFYGAGCIKNQNTDIIQNGLQKYFKNAEIEVEDDMIGTARSIFGNKPGIACILGTGANSCKYDGVNIIEKVPSLGYILGDEASGAYFGKILLNNYFKNMMPKDLADKFNIEYKPAESEILNQVYKQPYPNRFLAKFTYFLSKNLNHIYVQNLLAKGFEIFIRMNIFKYNNFQNYPVGFNGSIAYHFSGILNEVAVKNKIKIDTIIEKPIDGLIRYHLK